MRMFERRVVMIFGPKTDEVTGELRRLGNAELNEVYSPNRIWVIE